MSSFDEPVAVIGMACRTAGAEDVDGLWRVLASERREIGPVPEGRVPGVDSGPVRAGPFHAALLADPSGFDAEFFGISRRIAAWMDPHQRLLLELTWHALEDAALAPEDLAGLDVGVFAAAPMADFRERMVEARLVDSAAFPGTLTAFAANRMSHQFDWRGPSYALDSACSSGLSVLAPAVDALRAGRIPLAAVMAANVTCNGFYTSSAYRAGALSPTGRSVPFGEHRDGYVRGEGGACLILKRLDDAVRDHDRVHAVIRAVVLSHNGRAGGLTGSDGATQSALIRATARAADVPVTSIGYLEAHGTGTGGDLAEAEGIATALHADAPSLHAGGPDGRLWMGSIKANTGHLEVAAGLLGLVKAALILRHDLIPPIAGLRRTDPEIEKRLRGVAVANRPVPWPAGGRPRRIAVNSFGVGGSLACALVEDGPRPAPPHPAGPGITDPAASLIPLSAATPAALAATARRLRARLRAAGEFGPGPLAWTLQTGRGHLRERRLTVTDAPHLLGEALDAVARSVGHPLVATPDDERALAGLPPTHRELGRAWLAGKRVPWAALWATAPAPCPDLLPGYPFQRTPHWFGPRPTPAPAPAPTPTPAPAP
ncbi:polyketide synthase (plasmid) [Streptomyces sp. BI20]|uniref:beta-ketoacyl [acyl carrier protein] synthase domain-containing protein n=1 Tax=Streptomyces sp. BI20 TaxID=3403460 RepID=UPI003C746E66